MKFYKKNKTINLIKDGEKNYTDDSSENIYIYTNKQQINENGSLSLITSEIQIKTTLRVISQQ